MEYTYEYFKKSADYVKSIIGDFVPEIGMILGTGLNNYAKKIENPIEIPYREIPNFLISTAPDHAGKLIIGTVDGRRVVCMAGRFHYYEGYDFEQLVIPVRVMKLLDIKLLIVTNAAGIINPYYKVGDVMLIKDQIKLYGGSPLRGKNIPEFGPRFFSITNAYDRSLIKIAKECANGINLNVHEGVYFFFPGPQFESIAEINAARMLGGDAAGMSTVTEVLTAAHMGLPVLGMSLLTNVAAGLSLESGNDDEVLETAGKAAPELEKYFAEIIRRLPI